MVGTSSNVREEEEEEVRRVLWSFMDLMGTLLAPKARRDPCHVFRDLTEH